MAGIKHVFTSPKADGIDPTIVRPSNWNDDHTITGNTTWNGFKLTSLGAAVADGDALSYNQSAARLASLGIGMVPTNILDITQTQNAVSIGSLVNASAGVAAAAKFSAKNLSHESSLVMFGTGWTTSGSSRQDGALLYTNGAGGFAFEIPSDVFRWYQAAQMVMSVSAAGFNISNSAGNTSILPPIVTSGSAANTNYDIGAASEFLGYRMQLIWNGGDGFAEGYISSVSTFRTTASSQGTGGNNQFDNQNNFASNAGEGISVTVSGGRVYVQTKSGYTGTTVKIHRMGGV